MSKQSTHLDVVTLLEEAKLWSMEGMDDVELAEDMPERFILCKDIISIILNKF